VFFLVLAVVPSSGDDETAANAELTTLKSSFVGQPLGDAEAPLVAFARRWPATEAAAKALLWAGDLAVTRRPKLARARYEEVAARFPSGEPHALAERGVGNAELEMHHWSAAMRSFDAALVGATPIVTAEVLEKRAHAARERGRFALESLASLLVLGTLCYFGARVVRAVPVLPLEPIFLAPIYALFLLLAWGRNRDVLHALAWVAAGSLALVSAAFATPWRGRRLRFALDAVLLLAAHLAVFFIAAREAGILDLLRGMYRTANFR
jgi:hypothetical protein